MWYTQMTNYAKRKKKVVCCTCNEGLDKYIINNNAACTVISTIIINDQCVP